ncbi:autotransporter assembly complex protein TamA [Croceibacterium aestuarii]|uniref:autotransporter assembly complex protein TamA n=1 Tax=Croceibacterium aestuarii TaxID=3064139 RepID=UPI00272E0B82|nr:BamA/TamA family outer membrane protein [Croceibacterium sp. D39]
MGQPVAAQDRSTLPELEDLIPDSAISNPEAWAEQGVPQDAQAQENAPPPVDSELSEMPLLDIPWPEDLELPAVEPLAPEQDITFAEDLSAPTTPNVGDAVQLSRALTVVFPTDRSLLPERDDLLDHFRELSTIEEDDAGDNAARLAAQAREDEALMERLLRIYGYYDAQVIRSVGGEATGDAADSEHPSVRFDILPGERYAVGAVDLGELAKTGDDYRQLLGAFGVHSGDPLNSFAIKSGQAALDSALGEAGYPFAAIDDPQLLIDHDRQEGDLTMEVSPNGKYRFGKVTSNLPNFLSGKHLATIARFEPGDLYRRSDEMDLRRAIQATGLVSTATVTPVEVAPPSGNEPGVVDMQVEMTKAKLRTVKGSIGYGTGEGFKLEGSWEHRNLFPPEGALKVRAIAGTQEQLAGVTYRRNNFLGRDQVLTIDAYASTIDYAAYDAQTASLVGTFERLSTLLFQKRISWSGGIELVATKERTATASGTPGVWQTYFIAALPGYIQWDTSDDLLNPTTGFRLSAKVSPEVARTNGSETVYVRTQLDGSYYRSVSDKIVLAGRARLASIPGAPVADIAPSRRLYAGGGGSVRGYGYQKIGPQSAIGDPTGGRSLAEFSLEARIQTGLLDGALGVVPFVDAGTVGSGSTPDFGNIKIGAGIGLRYYTSFGPVRVDLGVPINPGPNDAKFGVYVGLGQAF